MKAPKFIQGILKASLLVLAFGVLMDTPAVADIPPRKKPAAKKVKEPNVFERIHNFVAKLVDRIDPVDPDERPYPLPPRSIYDRDELEQRAPRRPSYNPIPDDQRLGYRRSGVITDDRSDPTLDPAWNAPNRSGLAPEMRSPSSHERVDRDYPDRSGTTGRDFKPIPPIPGEPTQVEPKESPRKVTRDDSTKYLDHEKRQEPPKEKNVDAPAVKPPTTDVPVATFTNKPGRIKSPYPPFNELDVTGLPPGSLAKDPSTGKVFRLPR